MVELRPRANKLNARNAINKTAVALCYIKVYHLKEKPPNVSRNGLQSFTNDPQIEIIMIFQKFRLLFLKEIKFSIGND